MESGAGGRNRLKKVILRKKAPREFAEILGKAFKLLLGHEFGSIWLILSYGAERLQPTSRMQKEGKDEKKDLGRTPAISFQLFHSSLEIWDTLIHNFIVLIQP